MTDRKEVSIAIETNNQEKMLLSNNFQIEIEKNNCRHYINDFKKDHLEVINLRLINFI